MTKKEYLEVLKRYSMVDVSECPPSAHRDIVKISNYVQGLERDRKQLRKSLKNAKAKVASAKNEVNRLNVKVSTLEST